MVKDNLQALNYFNIKLYTKCFYYFRQSLILFENNDQREQYII